MDIGAKVKKGVGGKKGNNLEKKPMSRSVKTSLQFLVGRIGYYLKTGRYSHHMGTGARSAWLLLSSEYLATKMLELAGNATLDNKKNRIIPRHVLLAVRNDEELGKLLASMTIVYGGVLPNITPILLPKKTNKVTKVPESPSKANKSLKKS